MAYGAGGGGRKRSGRSVLGGPLAPCSDTPPTGFYRDGCCNTGPEDAGSHTVCAVMTAEFLAFSKARGNDLSTPMPEFQFRGLKPGDRWCLSFADFVDLGLKLLERRIIGFKLRRHARVLTLSQLVLLLQVLDQRAIDDCR